MTEKEKLDTRGSQGTNKGTEEQQHTDGSNEDGREERTTRQDAFLVFNNEKDLKHHESIRMKISYYTGLAVRVKQISVVCLEQLLYAIDLDSGTARGRRATVAQDAQKQDQGADASNQAAAKIPPGMHKNRIVNLRFEDCRLVRKAAQVLSEWLKHKSILDTIAFSKVAFEDIIDFKKISEGIKLNARLTKVGFSQMNFDEEVHGNSIGRVLSDSRTIRELDVKDIVFDYRTFYDMCQAILNEKCRLNVLKLRGIQIGEIEGKIIQFILMKNKQIHTLDLSDCKTDDPANYEFFFEKMGQFCYIRYLTLERMQPDLSSNIEMIGESLAENTRLEVLILRENKLRWNQYQNFWSAIMPNRALLKINLSKTDLNDRVCEYLGKYLEQPEISLRDLDVSKNSFTDAGLKTLSNSLLRNTSVNFINFSQNKLKCDGFYEFVELMRVNTTIQEVSFGQCLISNDGLEVLSDFLEHNSTLRHLDISRNSFNDSGFDAFAQALAENDGLTFLDLAKNKDVTDDGSLTTLCEALCHNKKLRAIDLSGLHIRKPFLKTVFGSCLKRNITLQEVIGKIPSNVIQPELQMNITIEKEILPLYSAGEQSKPQGKDPPAFDLGLVEENIEDHSRLNLYRQPPRLIGAAFKLIRNYDIRAVDFTSAGIHDDSLRMLSLYLRGDPNLRSIVLDHNAFSDDGLQRLTHELNKNTKLAHLSIKGCLGLTDHGLQKLCTVISTTNTSLFQIDLDVEQFDHDLAMEVITESALNRDIQERLRPVRVVTTLGPAGEVIKVVTGFEHDEPENSDASGSDEEEREELEPPEIQVSQTDLDVQPLITNEQNLSRIDAQSQHQTETTDVSVQIRFKSNSRSDQASQGKLASIMQAQVEEEVNRYKTVVEVKFDESSKIGDCFQSALKAWRIYQPTKIIAENQNLTDDHIQELCGFLQDRAMVSDLNLRRNQISNAGAIALGEFISQYDETLTHLDITRNRIGQKGGQAILNALKANTRIIECQIKFGNPISNKMGRIIEREIKANIQAATSDNVLHQVGRYELVDKGSDFMRCAIKMTQLQNILHLSLPDNMLNLEDTRMIADLIKRNAPLRKLNLSTNQLDADCAALIADSLIYNQNLQVLDVSRNLLGDYGVCLLLTPLIRQKLQEQNFVSKSTPVISEKEFIQGKNVKSSKRVFKNIQIETQLQYLGLEENMTTQEAYKQIWLLFVVNPTIFVKIEDPETMNERDNLSLFSRQNQDQVQARKKKAVDEEAVVQQPEEQRNDNKTRVLPAMPAQARRSTKLNAKAQELQVEHLMDDSDATVQRLFASHHAEADMDANEREEIREMERQAAEEERQLRLAIKREKALIKKRKRVVCLQRFCCFKDVADQFDLEENMPSTTQICCWRFLRARRQATRFYSSQQTLNSIEKSSCTGFASILISCNYLILYANIIAPVVLAILSEEVTSITVDGVEVPCDDTNQDACDAEEEQRREDFSNLVLLANMGVLALTMICELLIICCNMRPSNTRCNAYLFCQLLTGFTMRAVILISAQLIAIFIQEIDLVNFALGVGLCTTLVLSQIRAFQIWLQSIKQDKNCLLPKVQQTFNICMATNYLAAATLYKKVLVEASQAAVDQTKALEDEREHLMSYSFDDDEHNKKPRRSFKASLAKTCKCCRWGSPKFYQLIMNDIPLIFCLPFAYIFGLETEVNAGIMVALTLFDLICMLFYLSYDEELSIAGDEVFKQTMVRIEENQEAYDKILDDEIVEDHAQVQFVDEENPEMGSLGDISVTQLDAEVKNVTQQGDSMLVDASMQKSSIQSASLTALSNRILQLGVSHTGLPELMGSISPVSGARKAELPETNTTSAVELASRPPSGKDSPRQT